MCKKDPKVLRGVVKAEMEWEVFFIVGQGEWFMFRSE
jgi:hypothetical protein